MRLLEYGMRVAWVYSLCVRVMRACATGHTLAAAPSKLGEVISTFSGLRSARPGAQTQDVSIKKAAPRKWEVASLNVGDAPRWAISLSCK